MPIWETANVEEQPNLIMDSWRIVEVTWPVAALAQALKTSEQDTLTTLRAIKVDVSNPARPVSRHLVGYVRENREGRLSTAIVDFDADRRICRSQSGRCYQLVGEPRWNGDARYVMERWMASFRIGEWRDVTDEALGAFVKPSTLQKLH